MASRETIRQNFSSQESREQANFFNPISKERLQQLATEFSKKHEVDLSMFSVDVVGPGDPSFDIIEVLTKLQEKYGPQKVISRLLDYGIDFSKPFEHTAENAEKMREVGATEELQINGILKGFIYNTRGNITYTAIRVDKIQDLAEVYSKKEKEERNFADIEEAKEYIRKLAKKYFYHELGHSVFRKMVTGPKERNAWFQVVSSNAILIGEIVELQKEKYPNTDASELMPIILDEAFAEIFSRVSTNGRIDARIASYPKEEKLVGVILQKLGFKL